MRNINAMIVPTGIGAKIGGFAGDANPACKLLAKASDLLITHPNVVNAAMLTDIPSNVVVVEGFLLDRFFANQIALRLNVSQRIAIVADCGADAKARELIENCKNACQNVYGVEILDEIFYTKEPVKADLRHIHNYQALLEASYRALQAGATALALLCLIHEDSSDESVKNYQQARGYDPIGIIEAKISHLVSQMFLVPSAHAPIISSSNNLNSEIKVHPRVAAEYLSDCFLASVIKCLQNSPQIIPLPSALKILDTDYLDKNILNIKQKSDDITIHQVGNLVVPYDCCNGVPMIESNKHDIKLICVENNTTNLDDTADIFGLRHILVANYLEAAGYLLANSKDKFRIEPGLFLA